jgi:hypothetical protein
MLGKPLRGFGASYASTTKGLGQVLSSIATRLGTGAMANLGALDGLTLS